MRGFALSGVVTLLCLLVVSTIAAHARDRGSAGMLAVRSTDPAIVKCYRPWDKSCFRITVQISASGEGEVNVGHMPDNMFGDPFAARAVVSSGASCVERRGVGLPMVGVYSDNSLFWREPGRAVSRTRPALLTLDFGCDGQIVSGDELQVQLPLCLDASGRGVSRVDLSTDTVRLQR